ncbi:MAG: hydroxymethylglutaryl-CoA lyase [Williamsia sp.]|nr:hydroxymethylglutaryl-CoA lyase [Williamsia sp.]
MSTQVQLVECPRDAMQGWKSFIPTEAKIEYIQSLLKVGFDTIDFGSFVSPRAIPQMADTAEVAGKLDMQHSRSKLLAIVANERGAREAVTHDVISYLGFPFSISETFQQRNTNSSIAASLGRVEEIQQICIRSSRQLVVYISMAFGNPYGDAYTQEIACGWAERLADMGISIISLADTVGLANTAQVENMTRFLVQQLPGVQVGVHLHSTPANWKEKTGAAFRAGCTRFDGALKGIGGCPMAGDALVGNIDTEKMIDYFESMAVLPSLNREALQRSVRLAARLFS